MEAWSNFYTVEVWKGFLCYGSAKGCTKRSYAMEARRVVSSWLDAMSTINWLHQVPQKIPIPWKRGVISTPWKCGKGSNAVEVRRVVLKVPTAWKCEGLY